MTPVRMGGGSGGGSPTGAAGGALAGTYPNPTLASATTASFVQSTGGGREVVNTIASSGAAVTLDLSLGNVQDVTLDAATVTPTLTGQVAAKACWMTVIARQDSVGGRVFSPWPASVVWASGNEPLLTRVPFGFNILDFLTVDGGTTWIGFDGSTAPYEGAPNMSRDNAVETQDRMSGRTSSNLAAVSVSGVIHFSFFRANKTLPCTKLGYMVAGVAAAATPTLVRIGLYSVASNGDIAAVCETDNLATGGCTQTVGSVVTTGVRFAATTFSKYAAPLSAAHLGLPTTYTVRTGQLYGLGLIVVSAATLPSFYGNSFGDGTAWLDSPRLTGLLSGQTDLPATVAAASLANSNMHIYGFAAA